MKINENIIHLINDACLEAMKKLPDSSIDLVLTDPPYGVTALKWDKMIPLAAMWLQLTRVTKETTPIVLLASQPFTTKLIHSNLKMFKYCWLWEKNKKTNFLNAKKQPLRQTEDIVVFYKKQCIYNPQKTIGHNPVNSFTKNTGDGGTVNRTKIGFSGGGQTDRYPSNIIRMNVVNNDNSGGDKFYPTQKPVELMEYLIKTYTHKGDIILDFTMGSGTTGVATKRLGRQFIGIEADSGIFNIAKERINLQNKED